MSNDQSSLAKAFHNEADQLSLLGGDVDPAALDEMRDANGRLPADAFRRARQAARSEARGPGRPLGSLSKRSEKLAQLVMQECGDPVLGMGKLYAMPLDQLCELILVADGTVEHQNRMEDLTVALGEQVSSLCAALGKNAQSMSADDVAKAADKLADAADKLESVARKVQGKPGQIALAALNIQLTARRAVAEYVHSKRAVAVDVNHKTDGVLVMPGLGGSAGAGQAQEATGKLGELMRAGRLEASAIAQLVLLPDGTISDPEGVIQDAEYDEVDGNGD